MTKDSNQVQEKQINNGLTAVQTSRTVASGENRGLNSNQLSKVIPSNQSGGK